MKQTSLRIVVGSWLSLFLVASMERCVTAPPMATAARTEATAPNDLATPLAVVLDSVDPDHKAILVAGAGLSGAARAGAVASGRAVIDSDAVPQTADVSLPAGYLRVDSVTLAGDEAHVRLWRGPIPKAKGGVALLDCGTGLRFELKRASDGTWTISSRGMSVC
jgi:hypothetical protein